jgi:hypothetical protein
MGIGDPTSGVCVATSLRPGTGVELKGLWLRFSRKPDPRSPIPLPQNHAIVVINFVV